MFLTIENNVNFVQALFRQRPCDDLWGFYVCVLANNFCQCQKCVWEGGGGCS